MLVCFRVWVCWYVSGCGCVGMFQGQHADVPQRRQLGGLQDGSRVGPDQVAVLTQPCVCQASQVTELKVCF